MTKNHAKISDEELMLLVQKGSKLALSQLYDRYSQDLLGYLFKTLNNEQLAQDIFQDTFMLVIKNAQTFNGSRKFKPWIYKIATNQCLMAFRKQKISRQIFLQTDTVLYPLTNENIDGKHFKNALTREITSLSHNHRQVFLLRYEEHLSVNEIAEIMDCPEGTVKSRLYHALKTLAKKLHHFNPNAHILL